MKYAYIFDTHSHYDDAQFDSDRHALLHALSNQQGIIHIVSCGCDIASSKANQMLADAYDYLYFSAGFHPENLEGAALEDIAQIAAIADDKKCVAIGEIGLDYHWMTSPKETQKAFFEAQITLANELNLPVIVHDREAHGDTLEILKKLQPQGVLHCFSGSKEMAQEIIKLGMYIGVNGVATFKNAKKTLEVVQSIPPERLVLETDAPYLAPEPHRGKRNDSSNIPFIAQKIGDLLQLSTQEVLCLTAENAKRLYRL